MSPKTIEWIAKHLNNSVNLDEDTISTVSDFALLWNIFEGTECESSISEQQIRKFSNRVANKLSSEQIKELLSY